MTASSLWNVGVSDERVYYYCMIKGGTCRVHMAFDVCWERVSVHEGIQVSGVEGTIYHSTRYHL